jgi:ankyrin repeat protein
MGKVTDTTVSPTLLIARPITGLVKGRFELQGSTMQQASDLMYAVSEGDIEKCRALIAAGADINDGAQHGTPLHIAAADGKLEICRLLVAAGALASSFDLHDHTPLTRAARYGHAGICQLLIDAGADPYLSRRADENSLTLAGSYDAEKTCAVLRTLLVKPISDDSDAVARAKNAKTTALLHFAMRGRADACRLLIDAGADLSFEDQRGWTPLLLAAANNHLDVCRLLIASGADPSSTGRCNRDNPLTPFQIAVHSGAIAVTSYFLEHRGEDCAQRTVSGRTMLQLAGKHNQMNQLLKSAKTAQSITGSVRGSNGDAHTDRAALQAPVSKSLSL